MCIRDRGHGQDDVDAHGHEHLVLVSGEHVAGHVGKGPEQQLSLIHILHMTVAENLDMGAYTQPASTIAPNKEKVFELDVYKRQVYAN